MVQSITEKEKKAKYRAKASEYLDRSEKVQEIVTREKELGRYQEHYKIEANSEVHIILDMIDHTSLKSIPTQGHGLQELFGRFLEPSVTMVRVEDPYIRAHHQVESRSKSITLHICPFKVVNFLRLCELCVR